MMNMTMIAINGDKSIATRGPAERELPARVSLLAALSKFDMAIAVTGSYNVFDKRAGHPMRAGHPPTIIIEFFNHNINSVKLKLFRHLRAPISPMS
jgi:hypothetical protein